MAAATPVPLGAVPLLRVHRGMGLAGGPAPRRDPRSDHRPRCRGRPPGHGGAPAPRAASRPPSSCSATGTGTRSRSRDRGRCRDGAVAGPHGGRERGLRDDPRRGAAPVRQARQRLLARARARSLPRGVRGRADRAGLARSADPRGVRRRRAQPGGGVGHPGGDLRQRRQPQRLPRPDVRDGHPAAPRIGGPEAALPSPDRRRAAAPPGVRCDRAVRRIRDHRHPHPRRA